MTLFQRPYWNIMNKIILVLTLALSLVACQSCGVHPPNPDPSGPPVALPEAGSVTPKSLTSGNCTTPAQLATDLGPASQAAVLGLSGLDPVQCPEVSMSETWSGGKLVFSDSPESPSVKAKMYEDATLDATAGTVYNRIFVYHTNGKSSGKMKFAVILKNLGTASGTLTVQQKGVAGPSTAYLYAGKLAFQRWLQSTAAAPVNVNAGATVDMDSSIEVAASPTYLMEGIYDYSFTQPHRITVCALDQNDNVLSVCPGLSVAARDTHNRGTFPNADKVYDTASGVVIDTAAGPQSFPVAGGTATDAKAAGTDVTDGTAQLLGGNYGILYRMHLSTSSTDGKNLGFLINPRGGAWGGALFAAPGITPGGKILIPDTTGSINVNTNAGVAAKYAPGTSFSVWAQFMPTGGSSFPVKFVAVPY
jgi:hypothetical protein